MSDAARNDPAAVGDRDVADDEITVELPDLNPRGTRQQWTRSALASVDYNGSDPGSDTQVPAVVCGTGHGVVRAFDEDGTELWHVDLGGMVVQFEAAVVDDEPVVLVGSRGETAVLALLDAIEGTQRWTHDVEADLGSATKETLFYYPMTVDLASDDHLKEDGRFYAAARRYERQDGDRLFESRIYAFDPDGEVVWTYDADGSPISIDQRDDRLAVAYNRCHGEHQCGLVVLDPDTGEATLTWDPGTEGGRRVGDVALDDDGVVVASHGDYRGYALDRRGRERWRVDLGTPVDRGEDTVYTYPNRVEVVDGQPLFVTGNTFPEGDSRDTDARHPREHTLVAVEGDEDAGAASVDWTTTVDGWLGGVDVADDASALRLAVGQHFRDRDPASHGLLTVDAGAGTATKATVAGVATAVADAGDRIAILEEPIAYHTEDESRGAHRLHFVDE
ncbi:outer membrane protein assembly factor BamB family protein [Haloparvum sp. AD34]